MAKNKSLVTDYNQIEKRIWPLAEPLAAACGAELIDVEFVREANEWYLRLYIDRAAEPVDHGLCEAVSNLVSDALDREDPIEQAYYLEVSSPGLERPLRRPCDFQRFAGRDILVRLYAPRDGKKEFVGRLQELRDGQIIIVNDEQEICFPLETVAQARLQADI